MAMEGLLERACRFHLVQTKMSIVSINPSLWSGELQGAGPGEGTTPTFEACPGPAEKGVPLSIHQTDVT